MKKIDFKKAMCVAAFVAALLVAFIDPSATTIIGMFLGSAMGIVSFKDVIGKKK